MTLADGPVILVLLDDDGTRRLHLVLVAVVRLRAFDVRNEGVRLSQLHALLDADLEHPHSSARVIYQIVASCLAEDTARFQHAFATMIGSCRVHLSPTRERPEEIE